MKAEIGKKVYVFTNHGLVKGKVVKERVDKFTGATQYKVDINIDRAHVGVEYNYWFVSEQLRRFYFTAIVRELFKPFGWFVKKTLKTHKADDTAK
jgi:hypothetical protein